MNVYCDEGGKGRLGYGYVLVSYAGRWVPLAGAQPGLSTVSKVRVELGLQWRIFDPVTRAWNLTS